MDSVTSILRVPFEVNIQIIDVTIEPNITPIINIIIIDDTSLNIYFIKLTHFIVTYVRKKESLCFRNSLEISNLVLYLITKRNVDTFRNIHPYYKEYYVQFVNYHMIYPL